MKSKLIYFFFSVILFNAVANAQVKHCGMDYLLDSLKKVDPLFDQKLKDENVKFREWSKTSNNSRTKYIEIGSEQEFAKNQIISQAAGQTQRQKVNQTYTSCPYDNTLYGPYAAPTTINSAVYVSNVYGGDGLRFSGMIAGNTYHIYTCGQNDFDTELTLYTAGGTNFIAYNDDACTNNQSEIYFTPTSTGSYDILLDEATGCGNTYIVSTKVYVQLVYIQGTCGYNNSLYLTAAAPAVLNQTVTFPQTWGGDFNRLTNLIAGNTYRIYTCGNTSFDTQLSVYTAGGGKAVAFNDDACGIQSEIIFSPLTSGDYDILLNAYPCSTNSINMDVSVTLIYTPRPIVTLPVVVHVMWNNTQENISDAQIQSQIDVLNQDFNMKHAGINSVPSQFRGVSSNPLIQFCLAQRDPSGASTNGITRTYTSKQSFSLPDTTIFHTSTGGCDPWDKTQYLNIWVCNVAAGTPSGIAFPKHPIISSIFGPYYAGIGVVLWYQSFGTVGTVNPYFGFGKNTVHEIGHWLGLWHLWNDSQPFSCGSDSIGDTPKQDTATTGLPLNETLFDYCTSSFPGLMYYNYMDYPDDVVRNMFTFQQTGQMDYALDNWYASMKTSQGCVACTLPALPGNITGLISPCQGTNQTYSISQVSGATSYSWTYPTGSGWSGSSSTYSITTTTGSGSGYVCVSAINSCGTSTQSCISVSVKAQPTIPTVNASKNPICQGEALTLSVTNACSGCVYSWSNLMSGTSISVIPNSTTSYSVTATNSCNSTSSGFTVTVNSYPTVNITPPSAICNGSSITLTAGGNATSYSWNTGNSGTSITFYPTTNTSYTVTGTNSSGCSTTTSTNVTVNPLPDAKITPDSDICFGSNINLTASGGTQYSWNTGGTGSTISVIPTSTTSYNVTVTNNNCSSSASTVVTVNPNPNPTITINGNVLTANCSTNCATFQWTNNGNATCTGNTANCTITGNGSYTVVVTDDKGCTGSYTFTGVGISEINSSGKFSVYPNPNNGKFTVSFNVESKNSSLNIFNAIGENIYSERFSSTIQKKDLNLKTAEGIYLIVFEDGNARYIQKVIIQ